LQAAPHDPFAARREVLKAVGDNFGSFAEIKRICNLPIVWPLTAGETEEFNRQLLLAEAFESGFRLFDTQVTAMSEYYLAGGVFGPIGVGWGKTLISLMIANAAWQAGLQKMCLFMPSQAFNQLTVHDIPWARTKVPITYPIIPMGGMSMKERRAYARSGKRGLYIIPYSLLSTKDAQANLEAISPEIIISDEAHNLANMSAARTARIREFNKIRCIQWVALSGTITSKGVKDYHHLIQWALRENNPLPNSSTLASEWGNVIDASATSGGSYISDTAAGPLEPLLDWARLHFPDQAFNEEVAGYRLAFQARCRSAPGYVASDDKGIGTSLLLSNQPVPDYKSQPQWEDLEVLMEKITEQWLTPNNDELEHAIHQYKWLYELTAGFYNLLTWPEPDEYAHRKGMTLPEADYILKAAEEHHQAGQAYASSLRGWLDKTHIQGCDTPFLVGSEMSRNGAAMVGDPLYKTWREWKDLDFEGRPNRDASAIRVCDYKIRAMLGWAATVPKNTGALVWVFNKAIGLWAYEYLKQSGYDVLHCPAGEPFDIAIRDPANGNKIIVASITAHGQSKNLQHFQHQYVLQWPRQAKAAEQMLGRTHRNGQMADELQVFVNATTQFDRLVFSACLNDALYIHQTSNRQKLIYCSYNPLPVIFPAHILQARGMQIKILTSYQREMMQEKFGTETVDNPSAVA